MITDALAANSLSTAGLISTITSFLIFLYVAFSHNLPSLIITLVDGWMSEWVDEERLDANA